jgi:hypothetical protein
MAAGRRARRTLIILPWLVLHLSAGLMLASAMNTDQCACPAGMTPGQTCPMHHSDASTARCRIRGAQDDGPLLSTLIAVAPPPALPLVARLVEAGATIASTLIISSPPAHIPDSPPPRRA